MSNYFAYILQSELTGKLYKGHTQDLAVRLVAHNSGKTKSTKSGIPWRLVYSESFTDRNSAIERERYFKTTAGRRWIKKHLSN